MLDVLYYLLIGLVYTGFVAAISSGFVYNDRWWSAPLPPSTDFLDHDGKIGLATAMWVVWPMVLIPHIGKVLIIIVGGTLCAVVAGLLYLVGKACNFKL